ncbi:MAG: CRTAC1 family protein, partial [Proteobacteria bacterium]|nr:CRTAC1 family protein [Pseudomonadota bacterium]
MMMHQAILKFFVLIALAGCGGGGGGGGTTPPPGGGNPPTASVEPEFTDATDTAGLPDEVYQFAGGEPSTNASGLAAGDYDADGDIDLYVTMGSNGRNRLYQNQGDGTYLDVAAAAGVDLEHNGAGPALADYDGDGDLDLFVGAIEGDPTYLMRNDGGVFTDVTATSGLVITRPNTYSVAFGDYDQDGDLDIAMAHWGYSQEPANTETLWRNNGDGTFENVSIPSGVHEFLVRSSNTPGVWDSSFTPNWSDIDGDGDIDLLIAEDFGVSQVLINNGDGTFSNGTDRDVITDDSGMGAAVGDYDNDGDMDWFVTSIHGEFTGLPSQTGNRLYRNNGNGVFEDVTEAAGVRQGYWGWGACFADFDNDGHLDIFHVNGWPENSEDHPVVFYHSNGDGTFTERAEVVGLTDTGMGRGVACYDADRDGDLDITLTNVGRGHLRHFRNITDNDHHYLSVRLQSNTANRHGVGAWITVTTDDLTQVREVRAGNNYVSQNPIEAHFGLADATTADVEVRWPNGSVLSVTGVAADQQQVLTQTVSSPRLVVDQGMGGGLYGEGEVIAIEALPAAPHYYFSHWTSNGGGSFADA